MCLAVPGQLISIDDDSVMRVGVVDFGGVQKQVNLAFVPDAEVGEYVLVHVGFALNTIDADEAGRVFRYLDELGELDELADGEPSGDVS